MNEQKYEKYRARVDISGACVQYAYATRRELVEKKAIRLLTCFEPGFGGTTPQEVVVFRHVRNISGNRAQWEEVGRIPFSSVPEEQHEWRRREVERAARKESLA